MNTLDLILCLLAVILFLWGAWQGLVKSLFHLASWFGGIFAMLSVGAAFAAGPLWLPILAGLLAFVVGFILLRTMGNILNAILSAIPIIGTFNWLGGGLLGFIKASVLAYGILWALHRTPINESIDSLRKSSVIYEFWSHSFSENF